MSQSVKLFWDTLDSDVTYQVTKIFPLSVINLQNDLFANEKSLQEWLQQDLDILRLTLRT